MHLLTRVYSRLTTLFDAVKCLYPSGWPSSTQYIALAKKRAELKQRESAGAPVFSEAEISEVPQHKSFTIPV